MSKKIIIFCIITLFLLGLLGCQSEQLKAANSDKYEVVIDNFNKVTKYERIPERMVTLSIGELEICLELGLEDKIVGIVISEGYAKDYGEHIQKFPVLAEGGAECVPTLETIIDVEPDFVYGTAYAFNADYGIAAQKDFAELGINTYVSKGTYDKVVTIEDVYEDILNIGKIFNKEEKAHKVVNNMKEKILEYKVEERAESVNILVCTSVGQQVGIAGGNSLITSLIETVGAKNIFDDIKKQFSRVSWENIAERNPEVIVINEYEGMTTKEKIKKLKNNPVMADVTAIKEENFIVLTNDYFLPGLKNAETVKILAEGINIK